MIPPQDAAWKAGWDAGNDSMKQAGRTAWNEDDFNEAHRIAQRIWDLGPVEHPYFTTPKGGTNE